MNEEGSNRQKPGERARQEFARQVALKQQRRIRAGRHRDREIWFGLGMFGLVGWSVAIPTLLCIALGIWLDSLHTGPYSWTLMLLVSGVALGCLNAWHWVNKERREIERERENNAAGEGGEDAD